MRAQAYFVELAKELDVISSILYNQLEFWADKGSRDDGWVYKTYAQLENELGLTERQLRRAYSVLEEAGYIETKVMKENGNPVKHFRILRNVRKETDVSSETIETDVSSETIYKDTERTHKGNTPMKEITGIIKKRRQLKWATPFGGAKKESQWANHLLTLDPYAVIIENMQKYQKFRSDAFMPQVSNLEEFYRKYPAIKEILQTKQDIPKWMR